ncbi:Contactin-associated protein 1 [Holothuria leucospilota]|uniref:Contactin-associated protein 1 n=1 Tax=Holothuria leucospilota TaxID=206669 RepID=A0A9Q1BI29_HOLLE|nr:Contactin-associated protein 1 [Holothuria leucospilota]
MLRMIICWPSGFTDQDQEGSWTWSDGTAVSYTSWASGEPSSDYRYNCAGIRTDGGWEDYRCSDSRVSVCKVIYVLSLCLIALIQYTGTSTGCYCPFDSTRTDCACCISGGTHCGIDYIDRCYQSSTSECETENVDEWTLMMKVVKSSQTNVRSLWEGSSTTNDGSASAACLGSTSSNYKTSAANSFDTNSVKQVKFAFYQSGYEVKSLTFDSSGTSRTGFFTSGQLIYAPYTDIYSTSMNYFSMAGHDSISRHFFVSRAYGGCNVDSGWVVVVDYGNNAGCSWDTWWTRPFFIASAASTYQTWNSGSRTFPDIVAIFYKYEVSDNSMELCDSGWTHKGNGCYRAVEESRNWFDALDYCRNLRGDADLVSILDSTEKISAFAMSRRTHTENAYWIGLHDLNSEGTWEWSDGSAYSYTAWTTGEPNNSNNNENCAVLTWSSDGTWNDANCDNTYYFICKYPLTTVSCAEWKRKGYTSSTYYTIDPDGRDNGVDPFRVYCDMSSDGNTGIARIQHNQEVRTRISGYESARSYSFDLRYEDVSFSQAAVLADISGQCYQYIKWECHGSTMDSDYSAWYDRDGNQVSYWGGGTQGTDYCQCGVQGNCVNGRICHCSQNDNTWRTDDGYLNYKDDLPVTKVAFGDTGDSSEEGYITLGSLYCKSDESYLVTSRTDFMFIKDSHISGYNNQYISGVDQNSCASTCVSATSFVCRSFDYNPSTNECWLSEEDDKSQTLVSDTSYHLFVRIFDRQENQARASDSCPSGWAEYNSNCYRYIEEKKTWYDAEVYCQNQGGHIVTPADESEYLYVRLTARWINPGESTFWIGLNDIENEGVWTDAELNGATYTRWRNGEPNGGITENGVLMYAYESDDYIDVSVENSYYFVCKAAIGASAIAQPSVHSSCVSSWAYDDSLQSCYYFSSDTRTFDSARSYCQSQGADLAVLETDAEWQYLINYYRYHFSSRTFWIGATDAEEEDPTAPPNNLAVDPRTPVTALVTWKDPPQAADQNSHVTGYKVFYWLRDALNSTVTTVDISDGSIHFYEATGMEPSGIYQFNILAYSSEGDGPEMVTPINATMLSSVSLTDSHRYKVYIIYDGYRLQSNPLYSVTALTMNHCTNMCTSDSRCLSVNFHTKSTENRKTCDIYGETHMDIAEQLIEDREYTYASVEGM